MAAPNVTAPMVHLNGTSRRELTEQYENAARAVRDALKAVGESAPNGRDYYLQGTLPQAQREHESRITRLASVLDELEQLFEEVYE